MLECKKEIDKDGHEIVTSKVLSRHDLTWMEEDIRFALMNDIDFMVWGVHYGEEIEIF